MHKWIGWGLILLSLAALSAFFVIVSLPPLLWGLLIVVGAWLAFGKLATHHLNGKEWVGWALVAIGILSLGSFFFIISLPPVGFGVLVLIGAWMAKTSHGRAR